MKKRKKFQTLAPFLSGAVAALLVCACVGASLAASGAVRFNTASVSFHGKTLFHKGKDLTGENGAAIPSTILYTDEQGGGTTYVPLRVLAQALHMPMYWDQETGYLEVRLSGDQALYMLELDDAGSEYEGLAEEVEPIVPSGGKALVDKVLHQGEAAFEKEFPLDQRDGAYLSITVSNHGEYPLQFSLGFGMGDVNITKPTQIPAGATVTRTLKCYEEADFKELPIYMKVGNAPDSLHLIDAEITAVQFAGEQVG